MRKLDQAAGYPLSQAIGRWASFNGHKDAIPKAKKREANALPVPLVGLSFQREEVLRAANAERKFPSRAKDGGSVAAMASSTMPDSSRV